jgi:hypothetical protein
LLYRYCVGFAYYVPVTRNNLAVRIPIIRIKSCI